MNSAAPAATLGGGALAAEPTLAAAIQALTGALATLQSVLAGMGAAPMAAAAAGPTTSLAPAGAFGAPTAPGASAPTSGGGHAHGGSADTSGGAHAGHHGMQIHKREKPVDQARAQQNLTAVYESFSKHGRAGLDFKNNTTHGYLSKGEQDEFHRRYPGLPVPQSLVFKAGSNTPIGVVYRTTMGAFDLGMGTSHSHKGQKNQMQHLWFTPNHLEFAYSDVANGLTGTTAAAIKKLGYPT